MTRVPLAFISIFFLALPLFAQSLDTAWVRRYNGPGNSDDEASHCAIAADDSGNVYVTGYSYISAMNVDYATIKYNSNGDTAWVRTYNGPENSIDSATAIAVDDSGNVYVTGKSYGIGTGLDYATIKYKPNGDTAWVRRYNGPGNNWDEARGIAIDDSGYIYVTGLSYAGTGANYSSATIKYKPNGDTAWVRRYNELGKSGFGGLAVATNSYSSVCVTGVFIDSGTLALDYGTIKYLPNGDIALGWPKRYNGTGNNDDWAYDTAIDDLGNVYVTGKSYGIGTGLDYTTIKYKPNGDTAWVRRYNGPGDGRDDAWVLDIDGSGNVYVTGGSDDTTHSDYATIKYSSNGNTVWVGRYSGTANGTNEAFAIAVDGSNNVYVTGRSSGSGTGFDYATIKYYPNGDTSWVRRYNGTADNDDYALAIAVDGFGNVYVTGSSFGSGTDNDYATIKYVNFLRGDANKDGKVTISDVVYIINYLFKFGPAPKPIVQAGDANCDGKVTISDAVYLLNYLFKFGPAPCI